MIDWPDGVEDGPDGGAMRQVPQRRLFFASTLWVSEDGVVRRRYRNAWTGGATWGEPESLRLDDDDRLCVPHEQRLVSLERVIALAWLRRRRWSRAGVGMRDASEGCIAHNLRWDDEVDDGDDTDDEEIDGEEWEPLHVKHARPEGLYLVSNRRRVRAPDGRTTSGNAFYAKQYVAVRGVGLVDVATDAYRDALPPPCVSAAGCALLSGITPSEYAETRKIAESTAWSYMIRSAAHLDPADALLWARRFVHGPAHDAMRALHDARDPRLGDGVTAAVALVDAALAHDATWRDDPQRYQQVRLLRTIFFVQAEADARGE